MKSYLPSIAVCVLLLGSAVLPGLGQNTGGKTVPKLEPIAETRLLMEGLAHANFRGLERNLSKKPIDDPMQLAEKIQKVTAKDIKKEAGRILREDNLNLALIGPFEGEAHFAKILHL